MGITATTLFDIRTVAYPLPDKSHAFPVAPARLEAVSIGSLVSYIRTLATLARFVVNRRGYALLASNHLERCIARKFHEAKPISERQGYTGQCWSKAAEVSRTTSNDNQQWNGARRSQFTEDDRGAGMSRVPDVRVLMDALDRVIATVLRR